MISACRIKKSYFCIVLLIIFCTACIYLSITLPIGKKRAPSQGFVTTKFYPAMSARLGNYLFELLSLIGIANTLDRFPYITKSHSFLSGKTWKNVNQSFPGLTEQFIYTSDNDNITASDVYFHGEACCVYENVDRLKVEKENYLQLVGNYFQSYKYFDHLRDDIRAWLLPNITVQDRVRGKFPPRLNDDRYLICIHIRREDFVTSNQKEASNAQFSTRALNYLLKKYDQNGRKIGTIILGNEIAWEKQTFGELSDTHIVENSTVAEDFALSRMFCDAFLITAPSSSFGWFLGYVSKTMNVYYRDITDTTDLTSIEMRQGDFFPPNWVRLKETNSTVEKIATSPHLN